MAIKIIIINKTGKSLKGKKLRLVPKRIKRKAPKFIRESHLA